MIEMFDDVFEDVYEEGHEDGYQDGFEEAGVIFFAATERDERDSNLNTSQDSMTLFLILVVGGLLCLCLL